MTEELKPVHCGCGGEPKMERKLIRKLIHNIYDMSRNIDTMMELEDRKYPDSALAISASELMEVRILLSQADYLKDYLGSNQIEFGFNVIEDRYGVEKKPVKCGCGGDVAVLVGEDEFHRWECGYRVKCWKCGTQTPQKRTKDEAVEVWNRAIEGVLANESECSKINCPMQVGSVPPDCNKQDCPWRTQSNTELHLRIERAWQQYRKERGL